MWGKWLLVLLVAIPCQGFARAASRSLALNSDNDLSVLDGGDGLNLVLDPDKSSILATLEHLQEENNQLRQELQESQAQVMALVQGLQESHSKLRQQQENNMVVIVGMVSDMGKEVWEHLQMTRQQMQLQVSEMDNAVAEVKSQQERVMEKVALVDVVLDVVREFEDDTHNVTSQLSLLQDRLTSNEATVAQLQAESEDQATQLTAVQQRMDNLESLLQNGQSSGTPTPTTTTTTPTTTTTTPTTTTTTTSPWTAPQTPFTIPPDHSSDDSLITSILVTKAGKLILGDMHDSTLKLSQLDTPEDVEDVYRIHRPWAMVELEDGTIAVTKEHELTITVLKITGEGLSHVKDIPTERPYYAITQGPGNTLIVGSRRDHRTSSIDIIDMDGRKQRTLLQDVDFLIGPYCLRRFGDDVYVSDWVSAKVFRVNLDTGEVKFTLGELDMLGLPFKQPRKFDIDDNGNLYIATGGRMCNRRSFCIIQVTQSGSWQEMEEYVPKNGGTYPYGLLVIGPQVVVSWCSWAGSWSSEVASYSLPHPEVQSVTAATTTTTTTTTSHTVLALRNVALHKPSLQSTYHPSYGHPERAVDGNTATAISQCTHTADIDNNPNRWWRVDLMGMFEVEAVRITNRGDCCGYRLSDFNIYVMQSLLDPSERDHDPSDLCLHHNQWISDGATVRLQCDHPIVGQYVSLVLLTDSHPLHFCEIEVLGRPASAFTPEISSTTTTSAPWPSPATQEEDLEGCGSGSVEVDDDSDSGTGTTTTTITTTASHTVLALRNVALHKPSLQSTYHPLYGHPERAVDGNTATAISQCTHTADIDNNPNRWWRVDLMGMFEVEAVRITNRGDCCGYRLSDFNIYVMQSLLDPSERDHDPSDLCLHHNQWISDGATVRLQCDHPIVGQYVSLVLLTDSHPLHFCEIEVLGRPASATTESSTTTTTSAPRPRPATQEDDLEGCGSGSVEDDEHSGSGHFWFHI